MQGMGCWRGGKGGGTGRIGRCPVGFALVRRRRVYPGRAGVRLGALLGFAASPQRTGGAPCVTQGCPGLWSARLRGRPGQAALWQSVRFGRLASCH